MNVVAILLLLYFAVVGILAGVAAFLLERNAMKDCGQVKHETRTSLQAQ